MSIPPVTPVTRAAFFPRPKSSRHFSQQQPTNRRHKMSDSNSNTQDNSTDEYFASASEIASEIDEADRALIRFKWQVITIVVGYIAIVIIANIALSS